MNQALKIAVIRPGIHTLDEQFCHYLADEGFKVTLIAPRKSFVTPKKSIENKLFKVHLFQSINLKRFADFPVSFDLYFYLKKNNFDIIQSNEDFQFVTWIAALYARKHNKKFILIEEKYLYPRFRLHKFFFILFQKTICPLIWNISSKIICHSNACVEFMKKNVDNKTIKKLYYLPVGVNTDIFHSVNTSGSSNNVLKIVSVGRLIYHKNFDVLLKALKYIQDNKKLNIALTIVGEGPLKNDLMDKIDLYKLNNVEIKNNIPFEKLKKLYSEYDLFILPSRIEMVGATITEAMACGLPVIATKTGGMPDYIRNNKSGYLFENNNFLDLSDKIIKLSERKKLAKFGSESYKLAITKYDWKIVIKRYKKIILS